MCIVNKNLLLLFIIFLVLFGFYLLTNDEIDTSEVKQEDTNSTNNSSGPQFEIYEGSHLEIAVIGNPPRVYEDQITFEKVPIGEMLDNTEYDAVFIMEENLLEASKSEYRSIYLESTIPYFFMSANSLIPFTAEGDKQFNSKWEWEPGNSYAVGILHSGKGKNLNNRWGFGLPNDEMKDANIQAVYSQIFKVVEEIQKFQ